MGQIGKSKQKQNGEKIQMYEKWKNRKILETENRRKRLKRKANLQKRILNQGKKTDFHIGKKYP